MDWYPWLTPYYRQIIQQHQQGLAYPVMLMRSVAKIEIELLVQACAGRLLCQAPNGLKRCNRCHSCQLNSIGNHPDWLTIDVATIKSSIGVEPIREMIERLSYFPSIGTNRIVWIKTAEMLTTAAANALLKTLEEPPENCWFFLTTGISSRLPATLISRCRIFSLLMPAEEVSLTWLAKLSERRPEEQLAALRLSANAPAAALALLVDPHWQQRESLYQQVSISMTTHRQALLPTLTQGHTINKLFWLQTLLMDVLKSLQGLTPWLTNVDNLTLINHLAGKMPLVSYQKLLDYWLNCRHELLLTPGLNQELLLLEGCLLWESLQQAHARERGI